MRAPTWAGKGFSFGITASSTVNGGTARGAGVRGGHPMILLQKRPTHRDGVGSSCTRSPPLEDLMATAKAEACWGEQGEMGGAVASQEHLALPIGRV